MLWKASWNSPHHLFWPRFYVVVLRMAFFLFFSQFTFLFSYLDFYFPFSIWTFFPLFLLCTLKNYISTFIFLCYFHFYIPFFYIAVWFWISSKFLDGRWFWTLMVERSNGFALCTRIERWQYCRSLAKLKTSWLQLRSRWATATFSSCTMMLAPLTAAWTSSIGDALSNPKRKMAMKMFW